MELIEQFMAGDGWQKWVATAAILIIGYFVSLLLRGLVSGAINRTGIGKKAKTTGGNIGKSVGKAVFWLALLYTLFLALSRAGLGEYFGPVENLFDGIAAFLPKMIGAGFTFFIGFIVAKVAGNATTSVLEAAQVDNLAARSGVTEATGSSNSLAKGLGTLVFVLIIVPVAVAALGALNMDEISVPLTNMLFDSSINSIMMLDDGQGLKTSPSKAAGYVAMLITLVIGVSAAVDILGNDSLSAAFGQVQFFGGSLLKAAVLIAIGVFLASFMGRFMSTMMNSLPSLSQRLSQRLSRSASADVIGRSKS